MCMNLFQSGPTTSQLYTSKVASSIRTLLLEAAVLTLCPVKSTTYKRNKRTELNIPGSLLYLALC